MTDPERTARAGLIRGMLGYAAVLAAVAAVVWYLLTAEGSGVRYVSLTIFAGVAILLGYQVLQYVLDLRAALSETEGVVQKKWKRADLVIFMDSFYLTVDRKIFRVPPETWVHIDEGMYVRVVHFPHTASVVSVHELRPQAGPDTRI